MGHFLTGSSRMQSLSRLAAPGRPLVGEARLNGGGRYFNQAFQFLAQALEDTCFGFVDSPHRDATVLCDFARGLFPYPHAPISPADVSLAPTPGLNPRARAQATASHAP